MKRTIASAWIVLFPFLLSAQIGLINGYQSLHAPDWERKVRVAYELPNTVKLFSPSFHTGFNLFFPSKKKGVQWTPEIHLSRHELELMAPERDNNVTFTGLTDLHRAIIYGLTMNAEFFLFRLNQPVNDPAIANYSRLKRGLFLRLGLGFDIIDQRIRNNALDFSFGIIRRTRHTATKLASHFRIGLGMENVITDFLSVTPIISSTFYSTTTWASVDNLGDNRIFDPFNPGGFISGTIPEDLENPPRNPFIHLQAAIRLKINLKEFHKAINGK